MATAEQGPPAVEFAVVRRGYDPQQVTDHLDRLDTELAIAVDDRAALTVQSTQLGEELETVRQALDRAEAEIERLRREVLVLAGPATGIAGMDERLQMMLRVTHDEFDGMHAEAAREVADLIAAVGRETGQPEDPAAHREIDGSPRDAAAERARLDDEAAARRDAADEEFRVRLAMRCREALAQVASLQAQGMRTAQQVLDDAHTQARMLLDHTRATARGMVGESQREVDELTAVRRRLAEQLDHSRDLLSQAMPRIPQPAAPRPAPAADDSRPLVPAPLPVPDAERITGATPPG